MLVSLPTLLARGRRHKQVVPCFSVNSIWSIEAVAMAVSRRKGKAAVVIEAEALGGLPLEAVVSYALHAVHAASGEMAVAVRVAPSHEEVTRVLESGTPSLWVARPHRMTESEYAQLARWAVDRAYLHGCSVVGESGSPTLPLDPEELVREYGVSALAVSLPVMRDGRVTLDRKRISETVGKAKVPLIGLEAPSHASERQACAKDGIAGFRYALETLNEPFGAGLRTGLRDRSQSDPAVYQSHGLKAACEAAANLVPA